MLKDRLSWVVFPLLARLGLLAMAQPAPQPSPSSIPRSDGCFSLASSAVCSQWAAYDVSQADASRMVQSFGPNDTVVVTSTGVLDQAFQQIAQYPSAYDTDLLCLPNSTWRYSASSLCSILVGISQCNQQSNAPPRATLCQSTFNSFWSSFNTSCPYYSSVGDWIQNSYYATASQYVSSSNSTCIRGTDQDVKLCGFPTHDLFAAFCARSPSESCCLAAASPTVSPSSLPVVSSPVEPQAPPPQPQYLIPLAVVGALFVVVCAVVIFVSRARIKRRKAREVFGLGELASQNFSEGDSNVPIYANPEQRSGLSSLSTLEPDEYRVPVAAAAPAAIQIAVSAAAPPPLAQGSSAQGLHQAHAPENAGPSRSFDEPADPSREHKPKRGGTEPFKSPQAGHITSLTRTLSDRSSFPPTLHQEDHGQMERRKSMQTSQNLRDVNEDGSLNELDAMLIGECFRTRLKQGVHSSLPEPSNYSANIKLQRERTGAAAGIHPTSPPNGDDQAK